MRDARKSGRQDGRERPSSRREATGKAPRPEPREEPRSARRQSSRRASRPEPEEDEAPRGRSSSRRARAPAKSGVPLPLILGGGAGLVILVVVIAMLSGGGGRDTDGAKNVARAYCEAWKKGADADVMFGLEALSPERAKELVDEYRRKSAAETRSKQIPIKARNPPLARQALLQIGELNFDQPDKVALAREILRVAYRIYFQERTPAFEYTLGDVTVDGDSAEVAVQVKTDVPADPPELVPVPKMISTGKIQLVRREKVWKVAR